ncbi:MAG: DinB family protein [Acidimicrobiia bacterium]|nr:DinB family protein [Acidimicrobiia bacterium]MDH4309080.1 DinB family protein [Acidimicrobiia bacterium]MDH5292481.1 DinB family protein [Acidimicrobiia bacterium]
MLTPEEYLAFVQRALDGMIRIVEELGDDLANTVPAIPGANSPYATLHHCLGVMEYWGGHLVSGRPSTRDRESEFTAAGTVTGLVARTRDAQSTLAEDLRRADPRAELPVQPPASFLGPDFELTVGGTFLHIYEELAQHHGQMEVAADLLSPR